MPHVELITLMGDAPNPDDVFVSGDELFSGDWRDEMIKSIHRDTGVKVKRSTVDGLNNAHVKGKTVGKMTGENLITYMAAAIIKDVKNPQSAMLIAQSYLSNLSIKSLPPPASTVDKISNLFGLLVFAVILTAGAYLVSKAGQLK